MRKRVVVLGANFGGLTAALLVKKQLHGDVEVTVVSPTDEFLFTPSLIWLPFGHRARRDITFSVVSTLHEHNVSFMQAAAVGVDPVARSILLSDRRRIHYDYLIVATGFRNDDRVVPGFTENASTITNLPAAERAATAWRGLLREPGDVVVAASQGAGCFGAAYEFLFNTTYQLRQARLHKDVKLTFVTSEPFLGHFGIGGLPHGERLLRSFLEKEGIEAHIGVPIDRIDEGALVLGDGQSVPFRFGMVIPPFLGQKFLSKVDGLTDERGFVTVRPTYQSDKYDDLYAVGAAVAVATPWHTPVPIGVPKTGFPTERMAAVAAANIAAQVRGEQPTAEREFGEIPAVCVLDAGSNGVVILADKMLPPRRHSLLLPGPPAHWLKVGFEKYYLWRMRTGLVRLP